jgi:hypothetical protein
VSTKRTCRPYCLLMRERESTKNYLKIRATVDCQSDTAVQTEAQYPMPSEPQLIALPVQLSRDSRIARSSWAITTAAA